MRGTIQGAGLVLGVLFVLAQAVFWGGTSIGVVREHCADVDRSLAAERPVVESKWTYVVFPPLIFANLDPAGTCVRNSPLREALAELGVWELPSPEEQVDRHIQEQLEAGR